MHHYVLDMLRHEFTGDDDNQNMGRFMKACSEMAVRFPWLSGECERQMLRLREIEETAETWGRMAEAGEQREAEERRARSAASAEAIVDLHIGQRVRARVRGHERIGTITWIGRRRVEIVMHAAEFVTHSCSESTLHRWDIVGRDEVGWEMLAQPELTVHAIKILTEMPVLAEAFENRLRAAKHQLEDFHVVLRSEPHDDVIVSRANGVLEVRTESVEGRRVDAYLEPVTRLLALWGRREPSAAIDLGKGANRDALWSLFGW